MRFPNLDFRQSPRPAPDPGAPRAADPTSADSTLVVDAENGWAIGTAADLTEIDGDPVHNVLKRTEVWFGYKAAAVEKDARELAAAHAEKGQPRHDLPRTEPLEMEVLLEQRAREVLSGWVDRVHRQLQGAIAAETEALGTRLAAARRAVANATSARAILGPRAPLPDLRLHRDPVEANAGDASSPSAGTEEIHAERHLKSLWFWLLMPLLMLADFFANHPVFVELFPANRLLDQGFARWEEIQLREGLSPLHGIATMVKRAAVYPEPSILAGVVVLLLLFLGHTCGGHLRTVIALLKHRRGQTSAANEHTFRQATWPAFGALASAMLIVVVLGLARAQVLPSATERLQSAQAALAAAEKARAQGEADKESDAQLAGRSRDVATARAEVRQREERRSYAAAIHRMNLPIAGLNLALVFAAMLVGYLREEKRFSVVPHAVTAHVADHERRKTDLSVEFGDRRAAAHQALDEVRAGILRAEHLLAVQLLRDWSGKAERLRGIVSLFRIENARLRGLDVADIAAFRVPVSVSFTEPDAEQLVLERPRALDAYRQECARLQDNLLDLDLDRHPEINPADGIAAD